MKAKTVMFAIAALFAAGCETSGYRGESSFAETQWTNFFDIRDGRGVLESNGRREIVHKASAQLSANGAMTIRLEGDREYVLTGRWDGLPGGRYPKKIRGVLTGGMGTSPLDAPGEIALIGPETFDRFSFAGRSGRERFALDFIGGQGPAVPPGAQSPEKLFDISAGSGTLKRGGARETISKASVQMEPDGALVIRMETGNDYAMSGRWRGDLSGPYPKGIDVEIVRGFGSRTVDMAGKVFLDTPQSFSRFDVRGRSGNERVSFNFIANRTEAPSVPDGGAGGGPLLPSGGGGELVTGFGSIRVGNGPVQRVNAASVELGRGGRFAITVQNGVEIPFYGRWTRENAENVLLEIEDGFADAGARGSGRIVQRSDGRLQSIYLAGTVGPDRAGAQSFVCSLRVHN